jgi:DNA modification methylase
VKIEMWPIDRPTPYDGNPRVISDTAVDKVMRSLVEFGWRQPLLVDAAGVVVVGHARLRAARRMGLAQVPVHVAEGLSPEQVRAYRIADNRTGEESEWDQLQLLREVEALGAAGAGIDLSSLGFDADQLKRLVEGADLYDDGDGVREDEAAKGDADEAPPLNRSVEALSIAGQVYQLGPHRLMCGSSTDADQVKQLLGAQSIDCVWTDPPYGVSYVGGTADALTIENDDLDPEQLEAFLRQAFGLAVALCVPGAAWYVASPGGPLFHVFGSVMRDLGLWRQTILWVKDQFVLGRQDHHWKHEPLFAGETPEPGAKDSDSLIYGWKDGKHFWRGGRRQDTVWEIPRPKRSVDHPTMKPVALVQRCLLNSTRRGAVVYDPFGGSGTTMIAAAKAGCHARLMELSPAYCDVIRRRWGVFAAENNFDAGPGAL